MAYYDGELLKQNFGKALNEFEGLNVPLSEVAIKIGQAIKNTPTADVVEVKYGEWIAKASTHISKRGRLINYDRYKCSVCGVWNGRHKPNYCPHCGAKMDGGEAE